MRTLAFLGFLLLIVWSAGCATVTKTPAEVRNTYKQELDLDMRQIADDWNMIWLADRQYRLTRWYTR